MARVGAGVRVWPAVLCCASWSCPGRPVGQEFVFHRVGNGAEPQPGPGLVGVGKGVAFEIVSPLCGDRLHVRMGVRERLRRTLGL